MIAALIATIIGAAAACLPVYDRIAQWRKSKVDGHRSKEGGRERVMLNSPSAVVEINVTIAVFISDEEHLEAVTAAVNRSLAEGLTSFNGVKTISDSTMGLKTDEKP